MTSEEAITAEKPCGDGQYHGVASYKLCSCAFEGRHSVRDGGVH